MFTSMRARESADWHGRTLVDVDGRKIGRLQDVYVDVETDEPMFATVKVGPLGWRRTFVPLRDITTGRTRRTSRSLVSRCAQPRASRRTARGCPRRTRAHSTHTSACATDPSTSRATVGWDGDRDHRVGSLAERSSKEVSGSC
jgi:hypothetical protein